MTDFNDPNYWRNREDGRGGVPTVLPDRTPEWSSTRPTADGFYWLRRGPQDPQPAIVEIYGCDGQSALGAIVYYIGSEQTDNLPDTEFDTAIWSAPLKPPPA